MNYISICSGIEAATVAFHPLGWKPLAFSEIEPFPCALLAHRYPSVPNLGDMTRFHEWPEELLAGCDLLVGGPPCQAFSVAGLRNSLDDERGNLTLAYARLIDHIDSTRTKHGKPPIIALYENVPGIYSTRDNAFGCLVGALCGQDGPVETETGKWPTAGVFWGAKRRVGYRTLDAQYFGLAQRRRRCFLLAVPNELVERLGDRADPAELLSVAESLRGDHPPRRGQGQGTACDARGSAEGGGQALITHSLRGEGFDASEDGTGRGTPLVAAAFNWQGGGTQTTLGFDPGSGITGSLHAGQVPAIAFDTTQVTSKANRSNPKPGDPCHPLAASAHPPAVAIPIQEPGKRTGVSTQAPRAGRGISQDGGTRLAILAGKRHAVAVPLAEPFTLAIRGRGDSHRLEYRRDGTANALLTPNGGRGGIGVGAVAFAQNTRDEVRIVGGDGGIVGALAARPGMKQRSYLATPMAVRRLTPKECERLMGFPDDFTLVPYRGKPAADGNRYKALGNSMAVPCMAWLGRRIRMIEDLLPDATAWRPDGASRSLGKQGPDAPRPSMGTPSSSAPLRAAGGASLPTH